MFTPQERARVRGQLLEKAAVDARISGAAITGSAAVDREDKWSDIDLALGVKDRDDLKHVVSDWTALMYREYFALHHVEVTSGDWLYLVFLLPSTLQVDLAFAPSDDFRALGETFLLIFGTARDRQQAQLPTARQLIGLSWLYALHARTCIARKRFRQAEYMISAARDNALALACLRLGLPSTHGRGLDSLPLDVIERVTESFITHLGVPDLSRALTAVAACLLNEAKLFDSELGGRLEPVLNNLAHKQP